MITAIVEFTLSKTLALGRALAGNNPATAPFVKAYDMIEREYTKFVLRRFDKFSSGGGDWPPLSEATIAAKKSSAILVDTRLMRLGLGANGIGLVAKTSVSKGVSLQMGFTNTSTHAKANMSIADLAAIHHLGLGRAPRRTILALPPKDSSSKMLKSLIDAVGEEMS